MATAPSSTDSMQRVTSKKPAHILLPENPARLGPKSRMLLGRLAATLFLWQAIGTLLVITGNETTVTFGLSMVFPGSGFMYQGSIFWFVITQLALILALVLWWGISMHFAIPLIWLLSCVGGLALTGDANSLWAWAIPIAYGCAACFAGYMVYRFEYVWRAKRALIPEINEYLKTAELPDEITERHELDDMDAELFRWAYDFAFQCDDGLDGLDWGEQFHGGTQLRYQLNALAWGLSLGAANYLPNAPKRVTQALESIVSKHTDLRVWQYWHTLNLLGNFDSNPDPIRRDNIMFSAFLGGVINSVEAATGTDLFDQPESLEFVWKDGRVFSYDHHTINEAVQRNFENSQLGFFPCEPGWSFTVCNIMGAQALYGHDVAHGTKTWDKVKDRWKQTLDEEYATPNGSYSHIRSNHVGVSWDTGEVPGGDYYANGTHRFADILPEYAKRAKALEVRSARKIRKMKPLIQNGRLDLDLPAEPERHRTRSRKLSPWLKIIGGAQLVGEPELAVAAIRSSAEKCATGQRWPERPVDCSGNQIGQYMLLRWSGPDSLASLAMRGYKVPNGPLLADTDWEKLLVTEAFSKDGATTTLAARPYHDGQIVTTTLKWEQLQPNQAYRLDGLKESLKFLADDSGSAEVEVSINCSVRCRISAEEAA